MQLPLLSRVAAVALILASQLAGAIPTGNRVRDLESKDGLEAGSEYFLRK